MSEHEPVLAPELVSLLAPEPGQIAVDCTFGGGGHARLVAEQIGSTGTLICIDRDESSRDRYEEFEQLSDRFLSPHSPFGRDARQLRRRFHGGSFDETLDSAGRIRLPKMLVEHAGLDGPCALVGAGEYLEIWSADAWAKMQADLDARGSDVAASLIGGGE